MEFSPPVAYGILSPCNLWNSLPLEIKSSPSHPNFKNRLKSYYHVAKHGTPNLFRVILIYNSFVVCFAHSPWNINKNRIVLAFAVISKLRFAFSFTVNFHDAARAILSNRVCNIVTDNKSPELFFLIVWVTLSCWVYSHLACLMMSHHISRLLCFGPLVIFLSIVIDFDIRATLCIVYRLIRDSCFFCFSVVFFPADVSLLYLYDVPDASTSFSNAVFNTVDEFLKCRIRL